MQTDSSNPRRSPKILWLIPTEFERGIVVDLLPPNLPRELAICGFGPIVPAAKTIQLLHHHRPDKVLLLGIAGRYDPRLKIGQAYLFHEVACYGVGAGSSETFLTAQQMGWQHWLDPEPDKSIGDRIELADAISPTDETRDLTTKMLFSSQRLLLTVCSSAEHERDVCLRQQAFPTAMAEDMEGFAVAAACQLSQTPLTIIRGISNQAGDRDKQNWKIHEALSSAVDVGLQWAELQS